MFIAGLDPTCPGRPEKAGETQECFFIDRKQRRNTFESAGDYAVGV